MVKLVYGVVMRYYAVQKHALTLINYVSILVLTVTKNPMKAKSCSILVSVFSFFITILVLHQVSIGCEDDCSHVKRKVIETDKMAKDILFKLEGYNQRLYVYSCAEQTVGSLDGIRS